MEKISALELEKHEARLFEVRGRKAYNCIPLVLESGKGSIGNFAGGKFAAGNIGTRNFRHVEILPREVFAACKFHRA